MRKFLRAEAPLPTHKTVAVAIPLRRQKRMTVRTFSPISPWFSLSLSSASVQWRGGAAPPQADPPPLLPRLCRLSSRALFLGRDRSNLESFDRPDVASRPGSLTPKISLGLTWSPPLTEWASWWSWPRTRRRWWGEGPRREERVVRRRAVRTTSTEDDQERLGGERRLAGECVKSFA